MDPFAEPPAHLPSMHSLQNEAEVRAAVALWKEEWALIGARRKAAAAAPATSSAAANHSASLDASVAVVGVASSVSMQRVSSSPRASPHSSPSKQPPLSSGSQVSLASSTSAAARPLTAHVPSPPRSRHGSRMVMAAQLALAAQAAARLPVKRNLTEQLSASPARPPSVSLTNPAPAAESRLAMTMLRPPAPSPPPPAAAIVDATSVSSSPVPVGSSGFTPSKRHRLSTPPSSHAASASASASAASSPVVPACPPRPFYHMPARPLSAAELFPRSSPPAPASATQRTPPRSPSKKPGAAYFGALLSGSGGSGGSGGSRKRSRTVAVNTPGLHHSKGIYSFAYGDDLLEDRQKRAQGQRNYDEWMEGRRKAEARRKREEALQRLPEHMRQAARDAEMDSDEELQVRLTGTRPELNAPAAAAAAAVATSPPAAASSLAAAVTPPPASPPFAAAIRVPAPTLSSRAPPALTATALAMGAGRASHLPDDEITLEPEPSSSEPSPSP